MTWQRRLRLAVVPVLLAVPFLLTPGVAGAAPAGDTGCYDQNTQLTVEEQRLTVGFTTGGPAVGPELVDEAGFGPFVTAFEHALCAQPNATAADRFLVTTGKGLWAMAVARAQGRLRIGTLNRY